MMSSVVTSIQDTGTEVDHITGGCTGLAQPVDVGVGKPLKNRVRGYWEEYMITTGIKEVLSKPPSRAVLSGWIIDSLKDIPTSIIKNAWQHGQYSYFPNKPTVEVEENEDEQEELVFDVRMEEDGDGPSSGEAEGTAV